MRSRPSLHVRLSASKQHTSLQTDLLTLRQINTFPGMKRLHHSTLLLKYTNTMSVAIDRLHVYGTNNVETGVNDLNEFKYTV